VMGMAAKEASQGRCPAFVCCEVELLMRNNQRGCLFKLVFGLMSFYQVRLYLRAYDMDGRIRLMIRLENILSVGDN
ncbi:hypothetical protein Tco_1565770, partial [Tanacetum coccineum]